MTPVQRSLGHVKGVVMPKAADSDLCGHSKSEYMEFEYNYIIF